jgi:putative membrane protein
LAVRGAVGGVLMGLANLVPGISGGTMLLAAGVYPRFVRAVAEVSTLKFVRASVVVLATVVGAALIAVLLFAGAIKELVVHHRWVMYSLFIGLTLGGVPVVWRMVRPPTRAMWIGAVAGFGAMTVLAVFQQSGTTTAGLAAGNTFMLLVAGVAGASAMILPGVSGGYLLLVLGQYIPILSAIDAFKLALEARDLTAAIEPALRVLLPVGIGVVVGVVVVSNLLRWLLAQHAKPTLGVLLGLLLGAVVGLWPFQRPVDPVLGETVIKGQVVTADNIGKLDPEDYPTAFFTPVSSQVGGALALILAGGTVTLLISRFGREEE